jgi:hypothetical protein
VTALTSAAGADTAGAGRRPSWLGRLTWVTWRQDRATLIGLALFLGALALFIYVTGVQAYGLSGRFEDHCLVLHSPIPKCGVLFPPMRGAQLAPLLAPLSIGMFLGAPLLAREYGARTARFAWTQGIGRTRLVVTRLILAALTVLAAGAGLGRVAQRALTPDIKDLPLSLASGWQALPFNATPLTMAGSALLGLAVGVLAGAVARRVVPAMAATAAVVIAVFALGYTLHDRLLGLGARTTQALAGVQPYGQTAPDGLISLHRVSGSGSSVRPGSWLNQGWFTGPGGHRISGGQVSQLMSMSMSMSLRQLTARHISFWVSYQPASRYGLLVSVQAGLTVLLALILGALAIWLVRHRDA